MLAAIAQPLADGLFLRTVKQATAKMMINNDRKTASSMFRKGREPIGLEIGCRLSQR
jgi:hypothetical protein